MKHFLAILFLSIVSAGLAQDISKGIQMYYTHSFSEFDSELIKNQGISAYVHQTQSYSGDTIHYQKILKVQRFNKEGYPIQITTWDPEQNSEDSTTTYYTYDSLNRIQERKKFRLSKSNHDLYVLAEREYFYYNAIGIEKRIKIEMVDRLVGEGSRNYTSERMMITQIDSISYLSDSTAQIISNDPDIKTPYFLSIFEKNLNAHEVSSSLILLKDEILTMKPATNHRTQELNKFGYINYNRNTAWLNYIEENWGFRSIVPRELHPLLKGSDSVQFTDSLPDWKRTQRSNLQSSSFMNQRINSQSEDTHYLEIDTIQKRVYQYSIFSRIQFTSGPTSYFMDSLISIYDSQLRLLNIESIHHVRGDGWDNYKYPQHSSHRSHTKLMYYKNGMLHSIRRTNSLDAGVYSEDNFEIVYF